MNKKALIGIIAGVVALIIAIVCIVVLPGDKNNDKEESESERETVESLIIVGGEPANTGAVATSTRNKTCLANQREIKSQLINNYMGEMIELNPGDVYELRTNEDGTDCQWVCVSAENDQSEVFYELFLYQPYCPVGGNVIRVTITENGYGTVSVNTECCGEHETHA